MDGVDVPLIDPLIFGETDCSPNPSQNTILSNAVHACARPIQLSQKASDAQQTDRREETEDDDFIDPTTYDGNGPFIGRKSLLFLKQELLDSGVFVDTLPPGGCNLDPMEIVLREGFEPESVKGNRRYAPAVMTALQQEIDKQLALGVIEECDDVPVQEVVMVKKPDAASGFRFCIDARGVNKGVVVQPYALPPIAEILAGTAGCQYFARFDFISSYWQYPLAAESKRHTAFRALGKVYRYTRVPMGSIGASFHVQRSNVKLLGNLYGNGVGVYIDDTPMHAVDFERFVEIIRAVVKKFSDAKLYCKASKCVIGVKSLKLLGHIIDGKGIRMADDRREEVARIKFPDNPKKRNHKNLCYIHLGSSSKVVRWGLFLQTLSYAYNAIDGISNVFPDVLSRQDFNNENTIVPDFNDFDFQNNIALVERAARKSLLNRPMIRGKQRKKSLAEEPDPGDSKALAIQTHRREPRVIDDPDELPETKDLWSVVLPLVSRIMNRLYRWYLGCSPNDLVYLVPPNVDRGLFEPFRPYEEVLPVTTTFMNELKTAYEAMLDATSQLVYAEQLQLEKQAGATDITEFKPDDLVLLKYPTQAPSKLHDRLAGPYRVLKREERDVSFLIPFCHPEGLQEQDLVAIAAQDLGETAVLAILSHRGDPKKRTTLEFQVQWSDLDVSWEPWETVKKLALLDEYIRSTSDTALRKLLPKQQKGLAARLTLEGV